MSSRLKTSDWVDAAKARIPAEDVEFNEDLMTFCAVCSLLRGAENKEALKARWNGVRGYASRELPREAMSALWGLYHAGIKKFDLEQTPRV